MYGLHDERLGRPRPGKIVDQDVQGEWAYVRTESENVAGYGFFVVVKTPLGDEWTVKDFVLFEKHDSTLDRFSHTFGGEWAREKGQLDNSKREAWKMRWEEWVKAKNYVVVERPFVSASTQKS
jgi:hypothetical protein